MSPSRLLTTSDRMIVKDKVGRTIIDPSVVMGYLRNVRLLQRPVATMMP